MKENDTSNCKIPSLYSIATHQLIENLDYLGDLGDLPENAIWDVLKACTPQQLLRIESETKRALETEELWKAFCKNMDIPKRQGKTWRESYIANEEDYRKKQNLANQRLKENMMKIQKMKEDKKVTIREPSAMSPKLIKQISSKSTKIGKPSTPVKKRSSAMDIITKKAKRILVFLALWFVKVMRRTVYEEIYLKEEPNQITLEVHDSPVNKRIIVDKNCIFDLIEESFNGDIDGQVYYGIVGIVNFQLGPYLILISKRSEVGRMDGHIVYKLSDIVILRVNTPPPRVSTKRDDHMISVLRTFLRSKQFFFSYTFDLSNSLYRKRTSTNNEDPLWRQFDDRFFSNMNILSILLKKGLDGWILPLIRGVYQAATIFVGKKCVNMYLISRRSKYREGTRKTRGIDKNGHVANFVETEQILQSGDDWTSYVQIRGSVPLRWGQSGYKYTPIPKIFDDFEQDIYFKKHFEKLNAIYPGIIVFNLLSVKGIEQELCEKYEQFCVNHVPAVVQYLHFDFNEKCKTSYSNFKLEGYSNIIEDLSFFHSRQGSILSTQQGYIRTNCLDCLDRTNLVQSFFALKVFKDTLTVFNFDDTQDFTLFEKVFKEMWANNGDGISYQYAGTKALKTDFVRTGKQEKKGLMRDGANSFSRYYIGIFKDRFRKLAIDLYYGHCDVESYLSVWSKEQQRVIDNCLSYMDSVLQITDKEVFVDASLANTHEEDRILILSSQTILVFKYNFKEHFIIDTSKIPLTRIKHLKYGFYEMPKCIKLEITLSSSKSHSFVFKSSIAYTNSLKFIEFIVDSIQTLDPAFSSIEIVGENVNVEEA